jgi:hypothetical protein
LLLVIFQYSSCFFEKGELHHCINIKIILKMWVPYHDLGG